MRKRIWIFFLIVLAVCVLLIYRNAKERQRIIPVELSSAPANQPLQQGQPKVSHRPKNVGSSNAEAIPSQSAATERSNAINNQMRADWQKPIEFYGKVIDQNSNPVAEARVRFQWADNTENVSSNTFATNSDAGGLFSLHDKLGRSLDVWVSKEGYYASHGGYRAFLYSLGNDIYSPDPFNPVIFSLRKKGQGTALITSKNGISPGLGLRVPTNGTPIRVDLIEKQVSPSGQLEMSQIKPPWKEATDWSFSMSIPGGGFVENNDDFQFEAPVTNYQPDVQFHFSQAGTNWATHLSKQYYITIGQPATFGWLRVETDLSQQTVFITYAINPSGSTDLEPSQ